MEKYLYARVYDGVWLTKLNQDLPEWSQQIADGTFKETKDWLTENVYRYANLYDPEDLVKHVTGKSLDVKPFINYLEEKYSRLYG